MNEETKNIETCLAEDILAEVANVPTDPQFRSLTDEAIDPLKQQAAAQAGYDGYEKVVWTHKPYTFTSQVKQMKSNLILLLRRLWRFPFGSGTTASSDAGSASAAGSSSASASAPIRSLADMWQHYITRLKGNPEYGIPSRLSQLTDLPDAPALLSDRKISGVPEAADGMSVIHLMNDISEITEINDDNEGWTMTKNIFSLFTNIKKWISKVRFVSYEIPKLNTQAFISNKLEELDLSEIEDLTNTTTDGYGTAYSGWFNFANLKRANLRKLKSFTGCLFWGGKAPEELELPALETAGRGVLQGVSGVKRVIADNLKTCPGYSYNPNLIADCPDLEYATFAGLEYCNMYGTSGAGGTLQNLPKMEHLRLGKCNIVTKNSWNKDCFRGCGSLIKLEIIGNLNQSLYLNNWSPTLDDSNLQQFLSNFKTYIANRLTDNGSGLTLTLSQAVRNAIHAAEDEYGIENIIITQKGWTISPAPN